MPYRSEYDALRIEVDQLRSDLERAERGTEALESIRAELEEKLAALERARISAEEKSEAARRVRNRATAFGLIGGLLVAAGVALGVTYWPSAESPSRVLGPDAWFERVRGNCNSVEAENAVAAAPPPRGPRGQAYLAACYALAGRIDLARTVIDLQTPVNQRAAASLVFGIAHPIADAGNDVAAGPVMELVIEYTPENYMAVYHAGMSAYQTGDGVRARTRLARFLEMYPSPDGWRLNAEMVLRAIAEGRRIEVQPEPYANGAPWR